MTAGLFARNVTVAFGARKILDGVDAEVTPGTVTAIVGPNGAGKSTLLKVLSGDIVPQSGKVTLNGKPLGAWSAEECALQRAVLPQSPELAFSFRAWDVVELGRHPHRSRVSAEEDRKAIMGAIEAAEVSDYAGRDCRTLSGGEMHRTHYARALAQIWAPLTDGRTRLLLLDEPTASLDLFHQHAILAKARSMARAGAGVLAVLHDLNLAAVYADTLIVLAKGRVDITGSPHEVLAADRIARIWRVACDVIKGDSGKVQILVRPH
ncbi:MAG TPA: heme ABC transporter ATP-binding protein [Rhizomicrobium sp.]